MKYSIIKRLLALVIAIVIICLTACDIFPVESEEEWTAHARIVEIEKYGHAVLDITTAELKDKGYELGDVVCLELGSEQFILPYYDGYYCDPGQMLLRGGSPEDNVAICINYGDFAEEMGCAIGDTVRMMISQKAGALAIQDLCSLKYTTDRADYTDDETFANFRSVTVGRIGSGKLYRSASPINNEFNRAPFANALMEQAGIKTVLNLSDSHEDVEEFFSEEDFTSDYYRSLYNEGSVKPLDLSNNFYTDEFAESIVRGLRFLAQNEPPYFIHCKEGKDRTGVTAMLIGALMGAELQELIDDYMLSFTNYYGITKEDQPERYQTVLDINLMKLLCHVSDVEEYFELETVDLEAAVREYLKNAGMSETEIDTLQQKLGE